MWQISQNNKISLLKVDKSNVGPLCRVCEMLCRISRLCLGATVHKEGQLCWSSQHHLQLDIWTQLTVGLPAVAEAKASHQKLRPGTWYHGNSVVQAKHRNPHVLYLK